MNTKLYKKVHTQAIEMLKAADSEDDANFQRLYEELKELCEEHEDTEKNHPVQWETLADFTEDEALALDIYTKALDYAQAIEARDYMASICYAMALIYKENDAEQALKSAKQAATHAENIEDKELQREIRALVKSLYQ